MEELIKELKELYELKEKYEAIPIDDLGEEELIKFMDICREKKERQETLLHNINDATTFRRLSFRFFFGIKEYRNKNIETNK